MLGCLIGRDAGFTLKMNRFGLWLLLIRKVARWVKTKCRRTIERSTVLIKIGIKNPT